MGDAFLISMLAFLAMLVAHEIVRYRRSARDPGLPAYSGRRLTRRLGVASLLTAVMVLALIWPEHPSPRLALGLLGLMLALMAVGIVLLLRDLHETSRQVVAMTADFNRELSGRCADLIEEARRSKASQEQGAQRKQEAPRAGEASGPGHMPVDDARRTDKEQP